MPQCSCCVYSVNAVLMWHINAVFLVIILCSGEETEGGKGSAIYKKNAASEVDAATVDTVGPSVDTEMVKLNDAQPEAAEDATDVSYVYIQWWVAYW